MPSLSEIIELNLFDLVQVRLNHIGIVCLESIYADVLYYYYQCDLNGLQQVLERLAEPDLHLKIQPEKIVLLRCITVLRMEIRNRAIQQSSISDLLALSEAHPEWRGEIFFVVGYSFESLGEPIQSKHYYSLAARELERSGSPKKAVRALQNYVAAESRINPEKKLIAEYLYINRQARKVGEFGTAGVALTNVSREFQKMGALQIALKYCNRSLSYLERDPHSVNFFMALAHRCHLYLEMGRLKEAEIDYQHATTSKFKEVIDVIDALNLIGRSKSPLNSGVPKFSHLIPTWRERIVEFNTNSSNSRTSKLTTLENKLIQFLADGPKTKPEIIQRLYGLKQNFFSSESRFYMLISRLRKKRPDIITLSNSQYRLTDDSILSELVEKCATPG